MPQLAIYLDEKTARRLDAAARRAGLSRSRFVSEALRRELDDELPESFFEALGSWDDARDPKEILADIRKGPSPRRDALR